MCPRIVEEGDECKSDIVRGAHDCICIIDQRPADDILVREIDYGLAVLDKQIFSRVRDTAKGCVPMQRAENGDSNFVDKNTIVMATSVFGDFPT